MHTVDPTTEQMIRSVLAYAENRLRLDPVPLDESSRDPAELDAALKGLLGNEPHNSDQVLGVYTSVMAPAVISADSPRYLGFIPAAPTKAALLFDMLISCASIQGISWLEAAGAIHAENLVLRLIADRAGLPGAAGGCFVSGGSAGNLSALARFLWEVRGIWHKWLARRSNSTTMSWERFTRLIERYPLPPPRVVHSIYRTAASP